MYLIRRPSLEIEAGHIAGDIPLTIVGLGFAASFLEWPFKIMIVVLFWQVYIKLGIERIDGPSRMG